jgi:hypothetical protein
LEIAQILEYFSFHILKYKEVEAGNYFSHFVNLYMRLGTICYNLGIGSWSINNANSLLIRVDLIFGQEDDTPGYSYSMLTSAVKKMITMYYPLKCLIGQFFFVSLFSLIMNALCKIIRTQIINYLFTNIYTCPCLESLDVCLYHGQ